jgi:4-carboxymuconolactone decarboxylase
MDRIEKSGKKFKQLFGEGAGGVQGTDPYLQDILNRFIFGEVFYQGNLDAMLL